MRVLRAEVIASFFNETHKTGMTDRQATVIQMWVCGRHFLKNEQSGSYFKDNW